MYGFLTEGFSNYAITVLFPATKFKEYFSENFEGAINFKLNEYFSEDFQRKGLACCCMLKFRKRGRKYIIPWQKNFPLQYLNKDNHHATIS